MSGRQLLLRVMFQETKKFGIYKVRISVIECMSIARIDKSIDFANDGAAGSPRPRHRVVALQQA